MIGYDGDARNGILKAADALEEYFDVYIARIEDPEADFDSMDFWELYDTFSCNLMTTREYRLQTVQCL